MKGPHGAGIRGTQRGDRQPQSQPAAMHSVRPSKLSRGYASSRYNPESREQPSLVT